ncbi:MAG: hypothetical protein N3G78_01615 [Desulfobacterota bacterium]|nr:hypothetical protein [Thermodesulfobacteriota bacterium]
MDYIKIKEDWAWVEARGKDYDADLFALLLKKEKKWTIQGMVDPRIYPCPDLGECHHIGQFIYKKFKERFPSAPVEIFPEEHPECRAILIALREGLKAHHPGSMHFIVRYLKVKEGWAWVETDPRVSEKILEPLDALLQKVGGKWQVKDIRPCCGDCEEDPYCAKRIYHKKLIRLFPSVPKEIFPLQTR